MQLQHIEPRLFIRGSRYYYRRAVPVSLQLAMATFLKMKGKKTYVQKSLMTSDLQKARKLKTQYDAHYDNIFDRLSDDCITLDQALEAITHDVNEHTSRFARHSIFKPKFSNNSNAGDAEDPVLEMQIEYSEDARTAERQLAGEETEAVHRELSRLFADQPLSAEADENIDLIMARAIIERSMRALALLRGDRERRSFDPMFDCNAEQKTKVHTFGQAANDYLKQELLRAKANGRSIRWEHKLKHWTSFLIEYFSPDVDVNLLTYDDFLKFQSDLATMPTNIHKKSDPSIPLKQAIEKLRSSNCKQMAVSTQKEYMRILVSILDLAEAKKHILTNPARGMSTLVKSKGNASSKRPSFSSKQLDRLFTSAFYQQFPIDCKSTYNGSDRSWRFWLPLLMLFCGFRPNEALQLRVGDVRITDAGIRYFSIIPQTEDDYKAEMELGSPDEAQNIISVKTDYSRKNVPIHSRLIELGFDDLLAERRAVGDDVLLFDLKPDPNGYYSTYPCRRLREKHWPDVMQFKKGQTPYSLRHNFRDALRKAGAPGDVVSALGGWSEGEKCKVSDNYGDKHHPDYLQPFVEKLSYESASMKFRYS